MIIYIPLLSAIVGVLIYALSKNADVKQIGYALFWAGWLVTMMQVAGQKLGVL